MGQSFPKLQVTNIWVLTCILSLEIDALESVQKVWSAEVPQILEYELHLKNSGSDEHS